MHINGLQQMKRNEMHNFFFIDAVHKSVSDFIFAHTQMLQNKMKHGTVWEIDEYRLMGLTKRARTSECMQPIKGGNWVNNWIWYRPW